MQTPNFSFSKTLNPEISLFHSSNPRKDVSFSHRLPLICCSDARIRRGSVRAFPNQNKKGRKTGGNQGGSGSLFFRGKNPGSSNYADKFSEDELQAIGLGYDRMVRFMEKDDPNLRHPHDWYKYGEYGPYSWRGVVVGDPVRGRFSDGRVSLIEEVKSQEEWEKIEQVEMASDFDKSLEKMDKDVGFRYFWVFVRHPKWRLSELPWQQWTLVSEVVVEASKNERLDKWSLMGRLGNKARSLITQCAAWMRPDIVYVKKPVYQCRFEPQGSFFSALMPYLDPKTEGDFLCEVVNEDGSVQRCTYYAGLCKIVKVNPKSSFVDDVVKAYEKLSEEGKSRCLEFLLGHHPVHLLHPYTKEWKAKLEEEEMGCDAPDEDDDRNVSDVQYTDWIEDDDEDSGEEKEDDDDEKDWEEKFDKSLNADGDETEMRGRRAKVSPEEWEQSGVGGRRRVKKSKVPPEMFLRAAVRPFTYRNLVKEIVLTRHAILEGEIGSNN